MTSPHHNRPKPNDAIPHPDTGEMRFGRVLEAKSRGERIPAGDIELRRGKHTGAHRGFGAKHIWAEHRKEMAHAGFEAEEDVPRYVASIITTGAPIFYEGGVMRDMRVTVVRSSRGMAVLEMKGTPDDCIWSVVTAYSARNANGTRVGAVA